MSFTSGRTRHARESLGESPVETRSIRSAGPGVPPPAQTGRGAGCRRRRRHLPQSLLRGVEEVREPLPHALPDVERQARRGRRRGKRRSASRTRPGHGGRVDRRRWDRGRDRDLRRGGRRFDVPFLHFPGFFTMVGSGPFPDASAWANTQGWTRATQQSHRRTIRRGWNFGSPSLLIFTS